MLKIINKKKTKIKTEYGKIFVLNEVKIIKKNLFST